MSRHPVARSFRFQVTLISILGIALLLPSSSVLTSNAGARQNAGRSMRPRPGKPEGVFPDLAEVKKDSNTAREPAPPVPSTMRSTKNPLRPWDGRRVGDPGTQGKLGQATVAETSRVVAHASKKLALRNRDSQASCACEPQYSAANFI